MMAAHLAARQSSCPGAHFHLLVSANLAASQQNFITQAACSHSTCHNKPSGREDILKPGSTGARLVPHWCPPAREVRLPEPRGAAFPRLPLGAHLASPRE